MVQQITLLPGKVRHDLARRFYKQGFAAIIGAAISLLFPTTFTFAYVIKTSLRTQHEMLVTFIFCIVCIILAVLFSSSMLASYGKAAASEEGAIPAEILNKALHRHNWMLGGMYIITILFMAIQVKLTLH